MKPFEKFYPIPLIIVVTLAAWMLRSTLTLANFTMIYILVVLIIAIQSGTRVALAASLVSFLCINYFLVHPYYTFLVGDPREVLDLAVFFIVSALGGQLAARARQQAYEAQQRAREQEILYRLTRLFNQIATREGVFDALIHALKTDLAASEAYILPHGNVPAVKNAAVHYMLLEARQKIYGTLCVVLQDDQIGLLSICATQAAMALYRIELTEQAAKSQQFEESDRLKTALLHAVSHDLRTPITIIKTSANNLRVSPENRLELSQTIEHEADQLDQLVGNLLDMSRLRAGALTLNCELNSLEEVAGDAAARAYQRTRQERIRLNFPDDLPLVNFDYGLILQSLTNLIDNSLRYEPPDLQIEISGHIHDEEARLLVINHGEPIPPEERERIMEPFYHGKNGHIGLGLPIAKGIVEAHRGRLWVEDTPGGGTTFVIGLPFENEKN